MVRSAISTSGRSIADNSLPVSTATACTVATFCCTKVSRLTFVRSPSTSLISMGSAAQPCSTSFQSAVRRVKACCVCYTPSARSPSDVSDPFGPFPVPQYAAASRKRPTLFYMDILCVDSFPLPLLFFHCKAILFQLMGFLGQSLFFGFGLSGCQIAVGTVGNVLIGLNLVCAAVGILHTGRKFSSSSSLRSCSRSASCSIWV